VVPSLRKMNDVSPSSSEDDLMRKPILVGHPSLQDCNTKLDNGDLVREPLMGQSAKHTQEGKKTAIAQLHEQPQKGKDTLQTSMHKPCCALC